LHGIEADATVEILARLGVVILLFEVGLESTVSDMLKVGLPSVLVAVLGVVAPLKLGWGVGAWMLPDKSAYVHAFLGATLTATSVGITARVLQDLQRSQSPEARVILGAAVIDDVLGLVILVIVAGVISAADQGSSLSYPGIGLMVAKVVAFLFGALILGGLSIAACVRSGVASQRTRCAARHGVGVLLYPGLSRLDHWAGSDRRRLRRWSDPRGGALPTATTTDRKQGGGQEPNR